MKKRFLFNTGVHVSSGAHTYGKHEFWDGNGTKQIAFYCEGVPDGARFLFAQDKIDPLYNRPEFFIAPIVDGGLLSKFAYFQL